jgi:hypothetical protein
MSMSEKNTIEEELNAGRLENAGRRKAVKTIVGGVTAIAAFNLLPAEWGTPIIETVFLPAHAATSGTSLNDPCTVTLVSGSETSDVVVVRVSGFVTPATGSLPTTIVATPVGGGSAVTVGTTTADDGTFTTMIAVVGPGITRVNVLTTVTGADGSASCGINVVGWNLEENTTM